MKQFLFALALLGLVSSSSLYAAGSAKVHDKAASAKTTTEAPVAAPAVTQTATVDDENKELNDLCNTYAQEDGIAADKKAAYVKDCLKRMTDLSESMQEPLPLVSGDNAPAATPSSEQVNADPEKLVKSEVVDTPDPNAEQLDAGKSH